MLKLICESLNSLNLYKWALNKYNLTNFKNYDILYVLFFWHVISKCISWISTLQNYMKYNL